MTFKQIEFGLKRFHSNSILTPAGEFKLKNKHRSIDASVQKHRYIYICEWGLKIYCIPQPCLPIQVCVVLISVKAQHSIVSADESTGGPPASLNQPHSFPVLIYHTFIHIFSAVHVHVCTFSCFFLPIYYLNKFSSLDDQYFPA